MSTSTGTPGDLRRHLGLLRLTSDDSTTVAARLPWSTRPGRGPTGRGGLAPPLFWYWLGRQLGLEEGEQGRQQSARTLAEVRRRWLAACGELLPAALGDLPAPGGLAARLAAARRLVGELAPRLGFVAGSAADPPLLVVPWGSCPEVEGPAVPWDMTLNLDEGSAGAGARTGEEQLTEALRARGRPWGLLGDGRRWWLRLALPYPALPVGVDIDLAPILEEGDPLGWSLFVAVASCGALTPDGGADGRCPWERRLAEAERWQQQLEAELLHGAKRAGQLLAGAGARREGEGSRGRGRARAHARLQASTSAGASWAAARRIVLRCWAQLLGEARGRLRLLLLADGRACGWPELKQEWRRLASTLGSSLFRAEGRGAPEIGEPPPELLTAALDELRRIVLPGSCTALASAARGELLACLGVRFLATLHEQLPGRVPEDGGAGGDRAAGLYYTPPALVAATIHPALSRLVAGRGARTLEELRLLDPAMGAGGFLLEALDLLEDAVRRAERRQQGALPAAPGGGDQRRRGAGAAEGLPLRCRLAARCLHGVDRDALAVDLTRYALWLHALGRCSPAEPLAEPPAEPHPERSRGRTGPPTGNAAILLPGHLAAGLRRGNALTVLARAATGGLPAFPRRFAAVLGNPPYVGERGHGEVLAEVRTSPLAAGSEGKMDLWHAFALLAEQLLDDGGVHSFVVPVYWVTAAGGRRLRAALLGRLELLELFTLDGWRPFARAPGQETMIYLARRPGAGEQRRDRPWRIRLAGAPERGGAGLGRGQGRERTELLLARWGADRRFAPAPVQLAIVVSGEASAPRRAAPVQLELAGLGEEVARAPQEDLRLVEQDLSRLREHVAAHAPLRLPAEAVRQGVVPNPARLARAGRGGGTEGVFVLTADELATLGPLSPLEQSLCVSFHPPREIPAMARLGPATQRLLYLTRDTLPDEAAAPRLLAHLQRFRPRLEQRREVQQGSLRWCDLHWPRERELFETPSLLSPRQCTAPRFAFSPGGAYVDLGVNVLRATTLERALGWPVEALLALLSSRVVCWWLAHCGKRKGAIYQVDRGPLLELPLPLPRPGPCAALAELGRQAVAEGGPSPGLLRLLEPIAGSLYGLQPEDEAWIGEQLAEERRA